MINVQNISTNTNQNFLEKFAKPHFPLFEGLKWPLKQFSIFHASGPRLTVTLGRNPNKSATSPFEEFFHVLCIENYKKI